MNIIIRYEIFISFNLLQNLIQSEKQYRSFLVKEVDLRWDNTKSTDDKYTEISVWSPYWNPRPPPKWNQIWNPESRKLVYVRWSFHFYDLDENLFISNICSVLTNVKHCELG